MRSSFPSMMVDHMSGDEVTKHLGRQMSLHNEKHKEPEPEVDEVNRSISFSDVSNDLY